MLKQANARKSHVKVITPAVWAEKNMFSGIKSPKLWGGDSFRSELIKNVLVLYYPL